MDRMYIISGVTRTSNARGKIIQRALSFTNLGGGEMSKMHSPTKFIYRI